MDVKIVVAIVVAAFVILAIAGFEYAQVRRRKRLQESFGPEYDRVVDQYGEATRGEAVLERRKLRVDQMEIRPLPNAACQQYVQRWREVQRRFVDDPRSAVSDADDLVTDVMSASGYPMGDFEQRSDDISVNHPGVVNNYRAAHNITLRHKRGEASTEDLRKAMVYYRSLFDELLGRPPERREVA